MRPSRRMLLSQNGGLVHEFWRAHNREYLMSEPRAKLLYLRSLFRALRHKSVNSEVMIHSYCIMSNHAHMVVRYKNASQKLSDFMRVAHCVFGQTLNKIYKRQGAVAYDRPKTPLVQEQLRNVMRVHFYVEANPLRARMVRDLKLYEYSSYSFYAWGKVNEFTSRLTAPEWYMELGKTAKARQSRYRSLFNHYLDEVMKRSRELTGGRFIGSEEWVSERDANYFALIRAARSMKGSADPPSNLMV